MRVKNFVREKVALHLCPLLLSARVCLFGAFLFLFVVVVIVFFGGGKGWGLGVVGWGGGGGYEGGLCRGVFVVDHLTYLRDRYAHTMCCHIEIEVADQTFYLTQSQ